MVVIKEDCNTESLKVDIYERSLIIKEDDLTKEIK
jgi:hypothetical protein